MHGSSDVNRRKWFADCKDRLLRWAPWLGVLGFHLHRYARPTLVGWQGWVTWFGRTVGFVRLDGTIRWWP
jgi:hypothetical protein